MSVGVKVTLSVLRPRRSTSPPRVYRQRSRHNAVAFNCVALNAVPYVIAAGVAHVIVGVALFTAN